MMGKWRYIEAKENKLMKSVEKRDAFTLVH